MAAPTLDQLQTAWLAMRARRCLQHWPAEFEQVMSDPLRARCIAIEATATARQAQRLGAAVNNLQTLFKEHRHHAQAHHPTRPRITTTDLKRAAAGDIDD
jgi:hypothetical protein